MDSNSGCKICKASSVVFEGEKLIRLFNNMCMDQGKLKLITVSKVLVESIGFP